MVLINYNHKLIFLEIPKNASKTVRNILLANNFEDISTSKLTHETFSPEVKLHYKTLGFSFFVVVRNVEQRISSLINHLLSKIDVNCLEDDRFHETFHKNEITMIWCQKQIDFIDSDTKLLRLSSLENDFKNLFPELKFYECSDNKEDYKFDNNSVSEKCLKCIKDFFKDDYDFLKNIV